MKRLYIKLGKERHAVSYNKTIGAFFSLNIKVYVNIGICQHQPSMASVNITILRLTNPDVYLKRMNQLIYVWKEDCLLIGPICLHKSLCLPENLFKLVYMLIKG